MQCGVDPAVVGCSGCSLVCAAAASGGRWVGLDAPRPDDPTVDERSTGQSNTEGRTPMRRIRPATRDEEVTSPACVLAMERAKWPCSAASEILNAWISQFEDE
jgi:hypothetical protein